RFRAGCKGKKNFYIFKHSAKLFFLFPAGCVSGLSQERFLVKRVAKVSSFFNLQGPGQSFFSVSFRSAWPLSFCIRGRPAGCRFPIRLTGLGVQRSTKILNMQAVPTNFGPRTERVSPNCLKSTGNHFDIFIQFLLSWPSLLEIPFYKDTVNHLTRYSF
ncbi:hypothetical protein, partial [Pontibacter sp. HSC-36F09]|uniref:hypothetical protein n=1 Tax=Pontibacter sp. HSC-36F09 TaxID=2910966 RepID=UPI0020A1D195